jgi:alanine dehydrogenase
MNFVSADQLASILTPELVIGALAEAFKGGIKTPVRHHHTIERAAGETATLLLMPAWHEADVSDTGHIGIKVVSVFPKNGERAKPTILGSYLLLCGTTGAVEAIMDAPSITLWRTAAASALAARFLARPAASHLVMLGAGSLVPHLLKAHAAVRPIKKVTIWNRNGAKAKTLAAELSAAMGKMDISASDDLESAVRSADIVSAATLSKEPLIKGAWLSPGVHVDLVGGYTPAMREADDEAVRRSAVFVDTREGATREAGDIVQPLERKVITRDDIKADLFDLCRKTHPGRVSDTEITFFKSVGTAIEDLALATLVYRRLFS